MIRWTEFQSESSILLLIDDARSCWCGCGWWGRDDVRRILASVRRTINCQPHTNALIRLPVLVGEPIEHAIDSESCVRVERQLHPDQCIDAVAVHEVGLGRSTGAGPDEQRHYPRLVRNGDESAREYSDVDALEPIGAARLHLGHLEFHRPAGNQVGADAAADSVARVEGQVFVEFRDARESAEFDRPPLLRAGGRGDDQCRDTDCEYSY